jgi:hypothetical protein
MTDTSGISGEILSKAGHSHSRYYTSNHIFIQIQKVFFLRFRIIIVLIFFIIICFIVLIAGPELYTELSDTELCRTEEARITKGYKLPARLNSLFFLHLIIQ